MTEFYTAKHKRLNQIAAVAGVFSWVALVGFFFQAITQYVIYNTQLQAVGLKTVPVGNLLSGYFSIFNVLVQGCIFWLVLKGVSLGLNMIVETDLNYREQSQTEDEHE